MASKKSRPLVAATIASLRALSTELDRLDDVAARRYGLNRTDMRALDIIGRLGPLAPTDLARLLGFTTGGTTTVVDRLEDAGFVHRRPDPSDRRRLLVEITDATRQRDDAVFGGLLRATREAVESYTDDQLRVIQSFLDRSRELTSIYAQTLANGPDAVHPDPPKSPRRTR